MSMLHRPRCSCPRACFAGLACVLASSAARAQLDTTTRVSVRESGAQSAGISRAPSITAEGRVITFQSLARNLVVGDTNGVSDVFLRRRRPPATTVRLSVSSAGVQGNGPSSEPAISAEGRHVVYTSRATNLVGDDFNFVADVFLFDRTLETTTRISVGTGDIEADDNSGWPSISSTGRYVAFQSTADNLVPGDVFGCGGAHPCALGMDVFVRDRSLGLTTRVSTFADGSTQGVPGLGSKPSISGDGQHVAFESTAGLVPGDGNGVADVYVKDLVTGVLVRASGAGGGTLSHHALSVDGSRVVYRDPAGQIVLRDLVANTTTLVSQAGGFTANQPCEDPTISEDGGWAAFVSAATNLAPPATGRKRVFYSDLASGELIVASVDSNGIAANQDCLAPALSAGGRYAAFSSESDNLIEVDNNQAEDVFLRDRETPVAFRFCSGDGTGGPCPCGNFGVRGRGCENSFATGGTLLFADGTPSVAQDTLTLSVIDYGPVTHATLLQSDAEAPGGIGTPFGDGLACLVGNLIVLGTRQATLGIVAFGQDFPGDTPLSVTGGILPGQTAYYQAIYRHSQPYCTPAEFNTTNGLRVPWVP